MVTKLGPERCAMRSPAGWETFVQGSGNIDTKLLQGWVIVDTPRNHLTRKLAQPKDSEHEPKADEATPNFTVEHKRPEITPEWIAAEAERIRQGVKTRLQKELGEAIEKASEETRATIGLDPVIPDTRKGAETRPKRPRIQR